MHKLLWIINFIYLKIILVNFLIDLIYCIGLIIKIFVNNVLTIAIKTRTLFLMVLKHFNVSVNCINDKN